MYTTFKLWDDADWRIYFYLASLLIGGVGLTLLLVTMIWPTKRRKPRNPLLISLCFSWWLSTFPCLCVLYYARQVTGPPPSYPVCLTSAALTMGQSILVGTTAPALLLNMWLTVRAAVGSSFSDHGWGPRTTLICLVVPYVLFITFVVATLGVGLAEPHRVQRALFYCIVKDNRLTTALGAIGTVSMTLAIILELWTVVLLYKNQACIRQLSRDGHVSLVVRVCVFGIYLFLGLCLNVVSIIDWTNPVPDLFFSTFGVAVFLIFGTQRDIWRIWRDASRHITSSRSPDNSQHQSPRRTSFNPFGFRYSSQPTLNSIHPLSRSSRHLSLSRFNYSKSFSQSFSNNYSCDGNQTISLPLPAMLRPASYSKPPTIIIHSPDLTTDSEPATPTSFSPPPVPDKDPQYLSPRLIPRLSSFEDVELSPPSPVVAGLPSHYPPLPSPLPVADRTADYDTSGSQYSFTHAADITGSGRSRWSFRLGRGSTSEVQEGDTTIATGESAGAFRRRDSSPGTPSMRSSNSHLPAPWLPGDDGPVREWTAM